MRVSYSFFLLHTSCGFIATRHREQRSLRRLRGNGQPGDAVGLDEWRELPVEQQTAFRIPISIIIDLPHLRAHHPVITVSEYLRLHGQDPEAESSQGSWQTELYHSHPNVFGSNKIKMPSLFVIENQ